MASAAQERITVLGAGVIGLTSALVLAEAGYSVDIVARDLPEDSASQQFASPWAGANWHSFVTAEDKRQIRWETVTFEKMWSLIPRGLAMRLDAFEYYNDLQPPFWFKDFVRSFRELEPSEFPSPMVKTGITYTTWSVNAPEYIKWLAARLRTLNVPITRAAVLSIEEPFLNSFGKEKPATIVINATALGARTLVGVEDNDVFPIRGQTVLVWAPHFKKTIGAAGSDLSVPTYIIPRPGGEVVLGGTFGVNDWNLSPDAATTESIIKRCYELEPSLLFDGSGPESIPIIKVNVGLRPARKGGARLERETITVPFQPQAYKPLGSNVTADLKPRQVDVIHAYGIGGAGFQSSWGMANDVLQLVKESISKREGQQNVEA